MITELPPLRQPHCEAKTCIFLYDFLLTLKSQLMVNSSRQIKDIPFQTKSLRCKVNLVILGAEIIRASADVKILKGSLLFVVLATYLYNSWYIQITKVPENIYFLLLNVLAFGAFHTLFSDSQLQHFFASFVHCLLSSPINGDSYSDRKPLYI